MRVNLALNAAAARLGAGLRAGGYVAAAVPALVVDREEPVADWGDAGIFPHKTAATRAGLGWIGKTALLVTARFGPRVRFATVFTDLGLPAGEPVDTGRCGACRRCVDACPAGAGRDVAWCAGMTRDELYDEKACERQLEEFGDVGEVCGICIVVCPRGTA
jgi:epoxyqueuosine reductase